MITILCNDLGIIYPVMKNLLTMERATKHLKIFNSSKSPTSLVKYYIVDTYGKVKPIEALIEQIKNNQEQKEYVYN